MRKYFIVGLKGLAMGAADVVPGVSGGTIAFITGIYEDLLDSINAVVPSLKFLLKGEFRNFWEEINGNFLLSLFAGIGIAIFSLAKIFSYLLEFYPVQLWAFFFGLVAGSVVFVGSKITKINVTTLLFFVLGTAISYWITTIPASPSSDSLGFLFIAGAIAIIAMILPGISGSFILLLMGAYTTVLSAIKDLDVAKIGVFLIGCLVGLLSFSKLLKWTLKNYKEATLSLLTGFLLGSLNKLWPWKEVVSTRINSHNEVVPFLDKNVLPQDYSHIGPADLQMGITSQDPVLGYAIVFGLIGIAIIVLFWKLEPKDSE